MANSNKAPICHYLSFQAFIVGVSLLLSALLLERTEAQITSAKGHVCLSECRKSGQSYDWCYLDKSSLNGRHNWDWDYCSPTGGQQKYLESVAVNGIVSSNGIPCGSKCSKEGGGDDYRCTTKQWKSHTWDYCSPTPNTDYRMKTCSSKCEYASKNYKWCYVAEGGWGYCSKAEPKLIPEAYTSAVIASHGNTCKTKCDQSGNTNYNWCRTVGTYKGSDWDYCSFKEGYDYQGMKCSNNCGLHGYHYKWCNRVGGSWGYCSK